MIFAFAKNEFGHESYTSGFLLRYYYRDQFAQSDSEKMRQQIFLYGEHLKLTEKFLVSVLQKRKFNSNFFIVKTNDYKK